MGEKRQYFLCGVGGSGMLPLALILRAKGYEVAGSDRALDQGRTAPKFDFLRQQGIALFPQDGSGLQSAAQTVVASAAVEETVPDIKRAIALGAPRMTRAMLLAELFNGAPSPIGVAGTSGKSTTTGMIAWILSAAGCDPTVMNGAVMKNFAGPESEFASALVGAGAAFVSELDESDGSIALFRPKVAVLNNISLDHKSLDELRMLFGDYLAASQVAILNADDPETIALRPRARRALTFSAAGANADVAAHEITVEPFGIRFRAVLRGGESAPVRLGVPGRHNVANALAAMLAAMEAGVSFADCARLIEGYAGVKRRFEKIGEAKGVIVIDDFAHNPDKIAATLRTLRDFPGRLLVLFQPHGFGPLAKMRRELAASFIDGLGASDRLWIPEPVYYGGTADRKVSSGDLAGDICAKGRVAFALPTRDECAEEIVQEARPGDRVVIMGARDDTLPAFAAGIVDAIARRRCFHMNDS
jgi:UDP-N-acetylmuramate--alanine ligase